MQLALQDIHLSNWEAALAVREADLNARDADVDAKVASLQRREAALQRKEEAAAKALKQRDQELCQLGKAAEQVCPHTAHSSLPQAAPS